MVHRAHCACRRHSTSSSANRCRRSGAPLVSPPPLCCSGATTASTTGNPWSATWSSCGSKSKRGATTTHSEGDTMQLKNSIDRWGDVSMFLHWLILALVLWMAWLGLTMTDLPNPPRKVDTSALHHRLGLAILALRLLRGAWRLYAGAPLPVAGTPACQLRIATATHGGLYLLLLAIPVSGLVINSASGFPLRWFGLFRVPQLTARDKALEELAETWHEWMFWALVSGAEIGRAHV